MRLRPVVGSEQGGIRPVLIIQNDVGNRTQSYRHLRSHYLKDEQSEASNAHRDRRIRLWHRKRLCHFAGAASHH